VRIAFVLRHSGFLRNFESMLRSLAERGNELDLIFELPRPDTEIADRLAEDFPSVRHGVGPRRRDEWTALAYGLRHGIDYLRYLSAPYRNAPKLRERGEKGVPPLVHALAQAPGLRTRPGLWLLDRTLRAFDRAIPTCAEIDEFLAERNPDLVMVTPLVAGPRQNEYVRSARKLGVATALPVTSWDNLTNKGLIRDVPDRIFAWNEIQRREAIELHGVPSHRVVVVGAHTYDHWFDWKPSTTREEFLATVGLPRDRPYLLYLCSSGFVVPNEHLVIERWLHELRSSGMPELERAGVLVRPHPSSPAIWERDPFADRDDVAVWPPRAVDPRSRLKKEEYYDSIFHSAAAVGVNTSALIESAIVGRKSFTFPLAELAPGREGTLHYHYLVEENGGPLSAAPSFAEHFEQLARMLHQGPEEGWATPFLEAFVRPQGLDRPATPLLVGEVEALARARRAPARPTLRQRLLAAGLRRLRAVDSLQWPGIAKELPQIPKRAPEPDRGGTALAVPIGSTGVQMARGPLSSSRRSVRRFGYRVVHLILPAPVRTRLRNVLGGPSRRDERRAADKQARVLEKAERARRKEVVQLERQQGAQASGESVDPARPGAESESA
jgi:hypothetical protein